MRLVDRTSVASALHAHVPRRVEGARRAAVALLLRDAAAGSLELLFMLRAQHEQDPWSGHVSFPGGRAEPGDLDLEDTAVRETLEETGIDLRAEADRLGALDDLPALARGRPVDLVISPFVFHLRGRVAGEPSAEVRSLHWIPLERLLAPASQSSIDYARSESSLLTLPAIAVDGLVIWGLTYRMFQDLVVLLRADGKRSQDSRR